MGSAIPRSFTDDPARSLFVEIETANRLSLARRGTEDVGASFELLEGALDNLLIREAVLRYIAAYLSRTTTGSIPDHRHWIP